MDIRGEFKQAAVLKMSDQVLHRQLLLLGKVAMAPPESLMRRCVFVGDTLIPQVGRFVRRVGRPRLDWASEVMKAGAAKLGSTARLETLLRATGPNTESVWKPEMQRLFSRPT